MKKTILEKGVANDGIFEHGYYAGRDNAGELVTVSYQIEVDPFAPPVRYTLSLQMYGRKYLGPYSLIREETFSVYTLAEARAIAKQESIYFKESRS